MSEPPTALSVPRPDGVFHCGSQPQFYCVTDHPKGYCKKDCKSDADCPSEAICAFSGAVGACHQKCSNVGDCRAGYDCKLMSNNVETFASHNYCDAKDTATGVDASTPQDQGVKDGATGG